MSSKAIATMLVRDVMTHDPVCASPAMTALELAELFEGNGISGAPVVDVKDRVIGVVSRTDLVHRCLEAPLGTAPGGMFEALAEGLAEGMTLDSEALGVVEEFMTPDPVTASEDETIGVVAHRMASERVHRVIVVDDAMKALGVVTTLDLLKVFPEA